MKLFCGVLVIFGAFVLNDAAVSSKITLERIAVDQMLVQRLMDARSANPTNTLECFNIYLPIIEGILKEFSASYQLCSTNADKSLDQVDAAAAGNRTLITQSSQDVCKTMTGCSALEESLPFFDCYANVGNDNIKSLYSLTNTASDVAAQIREQEFIIQFELEKCQNASERAYKVSNAETTEALDYCLVNGPPPSVSSTTIIDDLPTTEVSTVADTSDIISDVMLDEELDSRVPLKAQLQMLDKYKSLLRKSEG